MILFEQKKYAEAAKHLEKAVALGVEDARIHNYLGICYAQTNRLTRAIEEHRRAVKLDPKLAEAHLNLGFDYEKAGKGQAALAEYEAACRLSEPMCRFAEARRKAQQN